MVGRAPFTHEVLAGAAGHGAASVVAADAKSSFEHRGDNNDAFGLIQQVLGNIVRNAQNLIEHHAAILQPVGFLIGSHGSERQGAKREGQKCGDCLFH